MTNLRQQSARAETPGVGDPVTPRSGTTPAAAQDLSVRPDCMWTKRIALPLVPPSINTNAVRSHWRGFHSAKKQWQADIEKLLMAAGLPRPLLAVGPVLADVVLTFPDRRRRDSENFRPVLSKALGDALVNGGWLADDTDRDWRLQVVIDSERGPHRTEIRLSWAEGVVA